MGTPAWQKREFERQQFFEKLMRDVWERDAREEDKGFLLLLAIDILTHIVGQSGPVVDDTPTWEFARTAILEPIRAFARTDGECDALGAQFVQKYLLPSALTPVFHELQREEFFEPKKIFGTEHATDDVEL